MPTTYRYPRTGHARYTVTVADDGAILVKRGDTLDKYSMAIHGVPFHEDEYLRVQNNTLVPVVNVDLIYTGETLYHIPTRKAYQQNGVRITLPEIVINANTLFDSEKQRKTVKYLEKHHKLPRNEAVKLTKIILAVGLEVGNTARLGIILGELTSLIGAWGAAHIAASIAAPFLALIGSFFALYKALTAAADRIELIAFCYGVTAWAYGKPQPGYSKRLAYLNRNALDSDKQQYQTAWQNGVRRGYQEGVNQARKLQISEATYKVYLRYISDDKPDQLCRKLAAESAKKLTQPTHLTAFTNMLDAGVVYNN